MTGERGQGTMGRAAVVGKLTGKLKSGGRAQGTFKAEFYDYYLTCGADTQNWTAQRMASCR